VVSAFRIRIRCWNARGDLREFYNQIIMETSTIERDSFLSRFSSINLDLPVKTT